MSTTGARAAASSFEQFYLRLNTKQRYMASVSTAWRLATRTEGEKPTVANLVYEEHISNDSFLQPTIYTLHTAVTRDSRSTSLEDTRKSQHELLACVCHYNAVQQRGIEH